MKESLNDRARWRWKDILLEAGLTPDHLSGRHVGCPVCKGGVDRFRWDNKEGKGTWICSKCGAGNGVQLVMKLKGLEFKQAAEFIESILPKTEVKLPEAAGRSKGAQAEAMRRLWTKARLLDGNDIASRYLGNRGISLRDEQTCLRHIDALPYWNGKGASVGVYGGMLAKFVSPDEKWATLHKTYLEEPGVKAKVEKPRMLMPGGMPQGGAVRLGPVCEVMGIAEGIETALSAANLYDVPVWAALSANSLVRWEPPEGCKHVIVFGDRDESFTGQMASYELAHKLVARSKYHVEVRLPWLEGRTNIDFNDVLREAKENQHEYS